LCYEGGSGRNPRRILAILKIVTPAEAGVQEIQIADWIPAFAGMTNDGKMRRIEAP